ncbi:MAG: type IV toxin-antitoxin system AbiEi family antitoxin domain-containing protein [Rhodobacteraceae bacterium]|nr:type IV toxin-antitoxin system AbiEi family antitoxin domain-containing protein [Paracoccaceae bacterium]
MSAYKSITQDTRRILAELDRNGQGVFTTDDLRQAFGLSSERRFRTELNRLLKAGFLERARRGIYVNWASHSINLRRLKEEIAQVVRRGHVNYLSLESVLCEYGAISQIMLDRITVMTTGRGGEIQTKWGVIEFTHTTRDPETIRPILLYDDQRPLPLVRPPVALRDLRRVGRNVDMVDMEEYDDILEEYGFADDPAAIPRN